MGSALTGGKPSWAQAAQQLVQRVRWDLGNEAVEFSNSDWKERATSKLASNFFAQGTGGFKDDIEPSMKSPFI